MRHIPRAGDDSTEVERIRYARAYILEIIKAAGELSWGSVMLATLYREMCEATKPNKAKIGEDLTIRAVISDEFF
ncbi:hypothetical protein Godav_027837 [Gossypium davidsonii]|uniref:Uncharacterized protein n=1 Tax=Gossypium davidsonii TaxID=34287 RepID=A0A7J8RY81_GOSDV|nr:hypothetical protein [Gossypium davidsonii]